MTDSSAPPPNRYPAQLVGVPQHSSAFAPPFIFPSKDQQKLLVNAEALAKSSLTNIQIAHNPTPYLNDAMNGFSDPRIQPPSSQNAKPKQLEFPTIGQIQQLTTPQRGLMSVARKGLAEQQIMQTTSANANLKRNNVLGAEIVLGKHLTVEEISNKTVTPQIRFTMDGKPVPVEFTPLGTKIGRAEPKTEGDGSIITTDNVNNNLAEDTENTPTSVQDAPPLFAGAQGQYNAEAASDSGWMQQDNDVPMAPSLDNNIQYQPSTQTLAITADRAKALADTIRARKTANAANGSKTAEVDLMGDLARAIQSRREGVNGLRPVQPRKDDVKMEDERPTATEIARKAAEFQARQQEERNARYERNAEHFQTVLNSIPEYKVDKDGDIQRVTRTGDMSKAAGQYKDALEEQNKERNRRIKQSFQEDAVLGGRHVIDAHPDDRAQMKAEEQKIAHRRSEVVAPTHNAAFQFTGRDEHKTMDEPIQRRKGRLQELQGEARRQQDIEDNDHVMGASNSSHERNKEGRYPDVKTISKIDQATVNKERARAKHYEDLRLRREKKTAERHVIEDPRVFNDRAASGDKHRLVYTSSEQPRTVRRVNPDVSEDTYTPFDVDALPEPPKSFKQGKKNKAGTIGKFHVHMPKLHGGVISLSYPNGKKVPGFPNAEVGPELQNQLFAMTQGIAPRTHKLTGGETEFLDNLVRRSNAEFANRGQKRSRQSAQEAKTYRQLSSTAERGTKRVKLVGQNNTDPSQQAKIIIGEMQAGNNSQQLRLKLRTLVARHKDSLPTDLLVTIHQALLKYSR